MTLTRNDRSEIAKELQRIFLPMAKEITFTVIGNEIFIHVRSRESLAPHPRKKVHFQIKDWNTFNEEIMNLP